VQEAADARSFRYVTAAIVACVFLSAFAAAAKAGGGLTWVSAQPSNPYTSIRPKGDGAVQDLIVRYFDGDSSISELAERFGLPFETMRDYVKGFEEKGLVELTAVPGLDWYARRTNAVIGTAISG
jgi:hypothetical protein